MSEVISLNGSDWDFKAFYGKNWSWRKSNLPNITDIRWWCRGTVPGSPHHNLCQSGEIPNPHFDRNYFCLFPGETQRVMAVWHNVAEAERKIEKRGWNTGNIEVRKL